MERDDDSDDLADMTFPEFHRRFPVASREMMREVIPMLSALLEPQRDSPQKWGAAFAVGAAFCAGRSMSEVAAGLGCSRALLSFEARGFCEKLGLPPSAYMKSEEAANVAKQVRIRHCEKNVARLIEKTRQRGITKGQVQ